jgi:hypothetical protein
VIQQLQNQGTRTMLDHLGYGLYFKDVSNAQINYWIMTHGMRIVTPNGRGHIELMGWWEEGKEHPDPGEILHIPFDWGEWELRQPPRRRS